MGLELDSGMMGYRRDWVLQWGWDRAAAGVVVGWGLDMRRVAAAAAP